MSNQDTPPFPNTDSPPKLNDEAAATLKQLDGQMGILVLVSGTLKDGRDHYAYASITPSKYESFKQAEKTGGYNLGEFGNILVHGEGKEPPEDVKKRMIDEYGANHCLEEDLNNLLARLQDEIT